MSMGFEKRGEHAPLALLVLAPFVLFLTEKIFNSVWTQ